MSFLYVSEADTLLRIDGQRVVAQRADGLETSLPLEKLEGVVIFGTAAITSKFAIEMLKRGLPVTWLSSTGAFFGRLESTGHMNIERQRLQFRLGDALDFCLGISSKFVEGKIHNQMVMLRRYNRNLEREDVEKEIHQLQLLKTNLEKSSNLDELRGYEGAASRSYLKALSLLVINPYFKFTGRSRRPPKDPFNSLLSFGYTLLMYEIYTAITNRGLHPYAAFFHQDRPNHPALASDLMEEWRPVIVDSLVMSLVQGGTFHKDDFVADDEGGVYLKDNRRKDFINSFEKKIRSEANYLKYVDSRMSFRRAIQFQVGVLAKCIDEKDYSLYQPVKLR